MMQEFFIEGTLPGFNEYISAAKGPFGDKEYNKIKKQTQAIVWYYARKAKLQPVTVPSRIIISWHEPNKRRDIDNVQAGAKAILDSLRDIGILKNDSWKWVTMLSQGVILCPDQPGVHVTISEEIL